MASAVQKIKLSSSRDILDNKLRVSDRTRNDHEGACRDWHIASRARPRRCAVTISPTAACGNYWQVGDVRNTAGRSMFVRLNGDASGKRAAGKWTDAATGEHGDLLDVIRESCGLVDFHDAAEEARRFLKLSHRELAPGPRSSTSPDRGSPKSARRLFAMSKPIAGTIVETYLRTRGITALRRRRQPSVSSALLLSSGSTRRPRSGRR